MAPLRGSPQVHTSAAPVCSCVVDEVCQRCISVESESELTSDPLLEAGLCPTPLFSRRIRQQYDKTFRKVMAFPRHERKAWMSQRVRQSAKSVYNRGKQILLPKVCDAVLKWAGLQHQPFVDAFSSRRSRLFHSYWDAEDNALQQNWSYDPSSKRNDKMLWLHPPQHLLSEVVR